VPFARWIARRLTTNAEYDGDSDLDLAKDARWPSAAWGADGRRAEATVSEWPEVARQQHLATFLTRAVKPLSRKATSGFLSRLERSTLRYEEAFRLDLRHHIEMHDKAETP
jgi:DNA (cytosine-5)-methyltransferase 1